MVGNSLPLKVHRDQYAVTKSDQPACIQIAVNFGILGPPVIYHMLIDEVRFIPVETIGNKDRDIILPSIAWCSGEQDPLVGLSNL